jgi:hypothetical protein
MVNLLQVDDNGNLTIYDIDHLEENVTELGDTVERNHTSINQIHNAFAENVNRRMQDVWKSHSDHAYMRAVSAQSSADSNTSNANRCKILTKQISDHTYSVLKDEATFLRLMMHNKPLFDHHFTGIQTKCAQLEGIPGCPIPMQCKLPGYKLG